MNPLGAVTFFNQHEAETVEAMASRILPGTPDDPGAREADVIVYIDRALAGAYRDLQPLYRRGVAALDERARREHGGRFAELPEDRQDALMAALLANVAPTLDALALDEGGEDSPLLEYFAAVVHQHTIEGMFGDPVYGGNKGGVGWRLIGFPGARWGYGAEEMGYGYDSARIPVTTLAELRRSRVERGGERGDG
jgi:gluconate 2-dehydrogenase gamma chain